MNPDFSKYSDNLMPVIIQDNETDKVLMLGFMNEEAFIKTKNSSRVTFFSRSKNRLWIKGETSRNFLNVVEIKSDCDDDTLLIRVNPSGPTCHTGADTCFGEKNKSADFLKQLENTIAQRKNANDSSSYTSSLFQKGINKIAQKVGEEATELIIEAKDDNDKLFLNEAADLMFHYLVLLSAKDKSLNDVIAVLKQRANE